MSLYHLGGLWLACAPAQWLTAPAETNYVGAVMLNQRNTTPTGGYAAFAAGLGWREKTWEFLLRGRNLTDRRKPVSESDQGDTNYDILTGRQVNPTLRCCF